MRASAENTGGGEVKENLVDGESGTKWLAFPPTAWLEFDLAEPVRRVTYAFTSANDSAERDPKDWTLQGSTDGKDWKTLDSRTGESFAERFQTKTYDLAEPAAYAALPARDHRQQRRRRILQLADVQFSTGDSGAPVPQDVLSLVDRGPSGSPTAKARRRIHRKEALRYAGRHKRRRAGVLVQQDLRRERGRRPGHRARYRIFPSMAEATGTTRPRTSPSTWPSPTAPT